MNFALLKQIALERRTPLIAAAILIAANVALVYYNIAYQSPMLAKKQEEWNSMRRKLLVADRRDPSVIYKQALSDLNYIRDRIPAKRQFPDLLGDIIESAAASSLKIGNVTYKPQPLKSENLISYSMNLSAVGSYAGIKSFLADIQKRRELIAIDSVILSSQDPYEERVTLELKLSLYLREAQI